MSIDEVLAKILQHWHEVKALMVRVLVWFKRLFVLVWLLILVFISAAITADNPQPMTLHLFGKAYQASAGFIFMVSLGLERCWDSSFIA